MARTRPSFSRGSTYPWLVVAMLWVVCFLNYADRQAIFSVFPLLKDQLHLSNVELGIVGSSFMWVYALFGPLAGSLSDRIPRRTLIIGALTFWSLLTAATAICHSFWGLVVCRALGGLGEAFYFPAAMSLLSDYHGPATRSRAMSLHQSGVYAGSVAGATASGFLGQQYGWRCSFLVFGAAGMLLALFLLFRLQEPRRSVAAGEEASSDNVDSADPHMGGSISAGLRELVRNPVFLSLAAVFIAANFVAVVFLTWMPTFLYEKFRMSLTMAGLNATAYLQLASVAGVMSGGVFADRMRRKQESGRLLTQAVGLLCGVPFLLLIGSTKQLVFLTIAMIGFGYFKGMYDANIFAGLYDVVPANRRGAAAGMLNSLGWLGGGFAPVVIGAAATRFGLSVCLSSTAAIYLGAACLMLWTAKRTQNHF